MIAVSLAAIALAGAIPVQLKDQPRIVLQAREIRLGDVVELSNLPEAMRTRLGGRLIGRIPQGHREITLTRSAVAGLLRRSVPALAPAEHVGKIHFVLDEPGSTRSKGCSVLTMPVAAQTPIGPDDVAPVACTKAGRSAAVRFDRRHSIARAAVDLAAGTELEFLAPPRPPSIETGERLTLVSQAGPVVIERGVNALQPGRTGERIFVQDDEGHVFTASVARAPTENGR